jgi:cytosine/adenosine deaminase-related metal-dependent hydrolase
VTSKILINGGCVLTLGEKTPNHRQADVLIDEGVVTEVGPGLRARDAEQVDASDTVVMPGFVDTHRHTSMSLFRNLGEGGGVRSGVAPASAAFGELSRPDDVYAATLIGLLGAAEAGITTVVDWSDVRPDEGLADAALQAHADAGLRTVLVHAPHSSAPTDGAAGQRTSLDIVAHLAGLAGPATRIASGSVVLASSDVRALASEWARAREAGLRIHAHAGSRGWERGAISEMAEAGLLGDDVTLAHLSELDDADADALAASGASVTMAPSSEMAAGLGPPPIQQLIDRDVRPGLGVDDERVAPGDLFAQMRAAISLQHATVFDRKLAGKAGLPRLMSTRDVIRFATIDGARVAGLGGITGSLEPGMQADVVVLRTDRPNVFPINDPIGAVVWGMDTSNVDWVFVAGHVVMREGVLEADVERARILATEARRRVADTSGLVVGAVPGGEG